MYKIYFSDSADDPLVRRASSIEEAIQKGQKYIENNMLDVSIVKIEHFSIG